jgi:hypothetical protein
MKVMMLRLITVVIVGLIALSGCASSDDDQPTDKEPVSSTTGRSTQPAPLPSTNHYYYVEETAHSVSSFIQVFNDLGGVYGLGFPLTEPVVLKTADGQRRWVQYFEKALVEHHPQHPSPNNYQLATLGVERFQEKYPSGTPAEQVIGDDAGYTFNETGYTVRGLFLKRWHDGGELRRFGYPISGSFEEKSDVDGNTYVVQYFERAVMEYHPELKAPYDVQLTALGAMKLVNTPTYEALDLAKRAIPAASGYARATEVAGANATATAQTAVQEANATAKVVSANATATAQAVLADAIATADAAPSYRGSNPGSSYGGTLCADGSYSSSTGSGTCSHHGGQASKKKSRPRK